MTTRIDPDDELDELEFDELDDFESDDFAPVGASNHGYLGSMWGNFKTSREKNQDAATIAAHGMVQSFVNAFARDGRYIVVFDSGTSTAGTDMKTKFVAITPAPVLDTKLDGDEAAQILTGLAVHEISHPRYGRMTAQAVERVFPQNATAQRVSNLLDDIRIERRFVADYPGYAGIFEPTLDYIGRAGGTGKKPKLSAPVNLAIAATRYPKFSVWTDPAIKAEFDWWNAWVDRWAKEDAPKRHVEAVREALKHIVDIKAKNTPKPKPTPQATPPSQLPVSGTGSDGGGEPLDEGEPVSTRSAEPQGPYDGGEHAEDDETPQDADQPSDNMDDDEINEATRPAGYWSDEPKTEDDTEPLSGCSGATSVDTAAVENGVNMHDIMKLRNRADAVIEASRNEESDGHGSTVDVNRSLRGITSGGQRGVPSAVAARYIRNAILQSRSGHTEHEPYKKHGRLDQRGLSRLAHGDYRLFEKRTAPSPGRYLIWVMVDMSQSMTWGGGYGGHTDAVRAAGVAHAMALASTMVPTVRMSVWAWTDAFRPGSSAMAGAALAWRTGMNPDQALRLSTVRSGGTPDSTVMGWAARAIKRDLRQEEEAVIIFVSDGGAGYHEMNERVQEAQKDGIKVVSVSFGRSFTADQQLARFGRGNYIPFEGSIEKTARPLAKLFARITGSR